MAVLTYVAGRRLVRATQETSSVGQHYPSSPVDPVHLSVPSFPPLLCRFLSRGRSCSCDHLLPFPVPGTGIYDAGVWRMIHLRRPRTRRPVRSFPWATRMGMVWTAGRNPGPYDRNQPWRGPSTMSGACSVRPGGRGQWTRMSFRRKWQSFYIPMKGVTMKLNGGQSSEFQGCNVERGQGSLIGTTSPHRISELAVQPRP